MLTEKTEELANNIVAEKRKHNKKELMEFVRFFLQEVSKISQTSDSLDEVDAKIESVNNFYLDFFKNDIDIYDDKEITKQLFLKETYDKFIDFYKNFLEGDKNSKKEQVEKFYGSIESFYNDLLVNKDSATGYTKKITLENGVKEINDYKVNLLDGENSIKNQINLKKEEIDKTCNSLNVLTSGAQSKIASLDTKMEHIGGFHNKLTGVNGIEEYIAKQQEILESTRQDADNLLKNVVSGSLYQGYLQSMQVYAPEYIVDKSLKSLTRFLPVTLNYIIFILPLVAIALIFAEVSIVKDYFNLNVNNQILTQSGLDKVLYKLAISAPLLWVSWFGQKSISQRLRLFEEYNHKARVAQIYLMFKSKENSKYVLDETKPENLSSSGKTLERILLDNVEHNPSHILGNGNTFMDKIFDIIKAKIDISTVKFENKTNPNAVETKN